MADSMPSPEMGDELEGDPEAMTEEVEARAMEMVRDQRVELLELRRERLGELHQIMGDAIDEFSIEEELDDDAAEELHTIFFEGFEARELLREQVNGGEIDFIDAREARFKMRSREDARFDEILGDGGAEAFRSSLRPYLSRPGPEQ